MSRFMLKAALVLGLVALAGGSVRAADKWFGPFETQREANAYGDYEISHSGATHHSSGYFSEDPTGEDQGAGYYLRVFYPDAPASPADPGGILGVPFPGVVGPADPGPDDGDPSDDGEMGS